MTATITSFADYRRTHRPDQFVKRPVLRSHSGYDADMVAALANALSIAAVMCSATVEHLRGSADVRPCDTESEPDDNGSAV